MKTTTKCSTEKINVDTHSNYENPIQSVLESFSIGPYVAIFKDLKTYIKFAKQNL